MKLRWLLILLPLIGAPRPCAAQDAPALRLEVEAGPVAALPGDQPVCEGRDWPDAPARAIHLADGSVQLYATDRDNRVDTGPDLLHLTHRCAIIYRGGENDDPAAYDDRAWIATPWTPDGHTVWAVVHNEFHGQLRPWLCPTGRYMDCWFNALTLAVSRDGGRSFQRPSKGALVAALPYRYDQVGIGHHGYFNPTNIVSLGPDQYMLAFATHANAQREGNCLFRTNSVGDVGAWRAWDGTGFTVTLVDPYAGPTQPDEHVCTPIQVTRLRWPVTSLVRHAPSGFFIAMMQDTGPNGGVFYATSPDLLHWSLPAQLFSAVGVPSWQCGGPDPIAYPSLLDPGSHSRNFEDVGSRPLLFATHFGVDHCHAGATRDLVRWQLRVSAPGSFDRTVTK